MIGRPTANIQGWGTPLMFIRGAAGPTPPPPGGQPALFNPNKGANLFNPNKGTVVINPNKQ
jgi:hypothetical protein